MKESLASTKIRLNKIIRLLKKNYPDAHCALHFKNHLELLIATQLSAQCTDKRVNIVTKDLFEKYKKAKDYAISPIEDLEKAVKSTGFYRNKAKHIKQTCVLLEKKHKGQVPKDFDELVLLPGVGRKTAHVVMGNGFQIPSGMVVDTHVKRLSNRMGLVHTKDVLRIEKQLDKLVPKKHWIIFSHWLIEHGRQVCKAVNPNCEQCFLSKICPQADVLKKKSKK